MAPNSSAIGLAENSFEKIQKRTLVSNKHVCYYIDRKSHGEAGQEKVRNMKLFHLSDLHLGKRLNEYSLMDDQRYILQEILSLVDEESPDAVLICGDVYDRPTPPAEAVTMFDDFLWGLSQRHVPTLIVSGNHDSAERLSFGSRIMEQSKIFISRNYSVGAPPVELEDEYGSVSFYLLPFVKPIHVKSALEADFPEEVEAIKSYTDAVGAAIAHMEVDASKRNVLLAHQFVAGAITSDSEAPSVGGLDNVDVAVFESFDYVALGHLHAPQRVGKETVRYSGTPLKYSFSEVNHNKSVAVVELGAKGDVSLRRLALVPLHDLRELRGSYEELMLKENYEHTNTEDYLRITLTDEDDVPNAIERLRTVYTNLMILLYDNKRTRSSASLDDLKRVESLTPIELLSEFYESQNNQPMDDAQRTLAQRAIENIWEAE